MRYRPVNQPGAVDAMRAPEIDTAEYRNFLSRAHTPEAAMAVKPGQWIVRDRLGNLSAFDEKWFRQLFEAVS